MKYLLERINNINNEIIKYKKTHSWKKELSNLFSDLSDTILTDKALKSKSQENENENGNDKTLMSSKNDIENENENEDDDETMSQNEKNKIITRKNDTLGEIIEISKLFEEQIKSLKKEKI